MKKLSLLILMYILFQIDSSAQVRLQIVEDWGNGFKGIISITPTYNISAWQVIFQLPSGNIENKWNGNFSQSGSTVTITSIQNQNNEVQSGTTITDIGFIIQNSNSQRPYIISYNLVSANNDDGNNSDSEWVRTSEGNLINLEGNVGIGTSSPGEKLTVDGDTRITGQLNIGTASLVLSGTTTDPNSTNSIYASDGTLSIQSQPGSTYNTIMNLNGGKVGIGTATPETTLEIESSSATISLDGGSGTSSSTGINLTRDNINNYRLFHSYYPAPGGGYFHVENKDGFGLHLGQSNDIWFNNGPVLTVPNSILNPLNNKFIFAGRLAIGTNDPSELLTVSGADQTGIQYNGTNESSAGMYSNALSSTGIPFFGYKRKNEILGWTDFDGNKAWRVMQGDLSSAALYLDSLGNLGIGTSAPSSKLEIGGEFNPTLTIRSTGSSSGYPSIDFGNSNEIKFRLRYHLSDGIAKNNLGIFSADERTGIYLKSDRIWFGLVQNSDDETVTPYVNAVFDGNVAIGTSKFRKDVMLNVAGNSFLGGSLSIGHEDVRTDFLLSVAGNIIAEEVWVDLESDWPDYVFEDSYDLVSLEETKQFIEKNHHLPNVPAAKEIEESGLDLGGMNVTLMKKVEELTLHLIKLNERVKILEEENVKLRNPQPGK